MRALVALRTCLLGLTLGPLAHAEPQASAPDEAMSATAKQLYQEAYEAYTQKNWSECRAKALAAWGVAKHRSIAGQLGECELELDMNKAAAEHLMYVIDHADGASEGQNAEARKLLAKAKVHVATLVVKSNVDGAALKVGKAAAGATPVTVFLEPGAHALTVERTGYRPETRRFEAQAGMEETWSVELKPAGGDGAGGAGANGAGGNGGSDSRGTSQAPPWPVIFGVTLGVGLAGVGAAAGITVVANNKASRHAELKQQVEQTGGACPSGSADPLCVELRDANDRRATFSNAALGTWIAAGALVAAAAVVGVVWATADVEASVSLNGVQLHGRF